VSAGATAFDVCGPLPGAGVTVLEASAGTGKTFTLAALAARYVSAGTPLSSILAVTFTRTATSELRDQVRRRLVSAEDALARWLDAGEAVPAGDTVAGFLAAGDRAEVAARRLRLAAAVASFDAATIATTHGFCRLVLAGLGSAGDLPAGARLLEDPTDLVDQVVEDLYLRWGLRHGAPGFGLDAAKHAARVAVANPDADLCPADGPDGAGLLARLARAARREVARRLHGDDLLTYDGMLLRLAETLEHERRGPAAARRLRSLYQVVMVDEFQDTDPVQWRVLRAAFGQGSGTTLVLIGDPKQAIYAFRGADVHAYLDAAGSGNQATLAVNWRADQPLLDATAALLDPLRLGSPQIVFRPLRAPADRCGAGLAGAPAGAPLRFRVVRRGQPGIASTGVKRQPQKGAVTAHVAADLAADVSALLRSGAVHRGGGPERRLEPADVAVLTRTHRQSAVARDALCAAGVPAVVAGLESVFCTDAARDWLRLLEALLQPASTSRVAAAALTPFVGLDAHRVATAGDATWEDVRARLHTWAATLASRGVAALWRMLSDGGQLPSRVLARTGGERELTDLGHVAELLHAEAVGAALGAPSLRTWLSQRIRDAGDETVLAEERSRRLDSDADAVQVLTVHRGKGLEFPVVYCPFLWDAPGRARSRPRDPPVVYHAEGKRIVDVGSPAAGADGDYRRHAAAGAEEERGEDLRVLYVALTRARHQTVLWWAPADRSRFSPLGRLLACRQPDGTVGTPGSGKDPADDAIRAALDAVASRAPGLVAVEDSRLPADADAEAGDGETEAPPCELSAALWHRRLDAAWRRSSYTSITAAAHEEPTGSEPEAPGLEDEPADGDEAPLPGGVVAGGGEPVPLDAVPGGTAVGTFVHGILEGVDFAAADLDQRLAAAAAGWAWTDPGQPAALAAGLAAAISTPLGPLLPGVTLRDVAWRDRLDELSFEMPLVGGDRPVGLLATSQVADVVAAHPDPDGRLAGYPARLADPLLASRLRGYLTGSLDLVFRRDAEAGSQRWYVADYKTNRLGSTGRPLTAVDYRPEALDAEMQRRHYPLQALIYVVALHRYLRWRVPGYTPDTHLGGVLYLFLRGMVGPGAPVVDGHPCGVFSWRPAPALVVALSELFDTGAGPVPR
jgi:exodeoxyribonuclease V beta subunit